MLVMDVNARNGGTFAVQFELARHFGSAYLCVPKLVKIDWQRRGLL